MKNIVIGILIVGIIVFCYFFWQRNKFTKSINYDFVKGEVLVVFRENIKYSQAKQLFESLNVVSYSNGYWDSIKKIPSDETLLSKLDLFTVKVRVGDEEKMAEVFRKSSIVENAALNGILHVN
jgi:hypothetical protein